MTEYKILINFKFSPVRDGMLVEIIIQIQSSPVRDAIYTVPTAFPKMCGFHCFYQYGICFRK